MSGTPNQYTDGPFPKSHIQTSSKSENTNQPSITCVPPSYDEATRSSAFPFPRPPTQQPYYPGQGFPPEHTITVYPPSSHCLQPCTCCPHNLPPPPAQYPLVVPYQPTPYISRRRRIWMRIIFLTTTLVFLTVFIAVACSILHDYLKSRHEWDKKNDFFKH